MSKVSILNAQCHTVAEAQCCNPPSLIRVRCSTTAQQCPTYDSFTEYYNPFKELNVKMKMIDVMSEITAEVSFG